MKSVAESVNYTIKRFVKSTNGKEIPEGINQTSEFFFIKDLDFVFLNNKKKFYTN